MMILSIISFVLLFGYLGVMAKSKGIPDMVSDTYYQLGKHGWLFTAVLTASALMMMIAILDSGRGLQAAAFIGTAGLIFVGFAPNYLSQDEYHVHKGAAILSALGCVAWCLSVNIYPTLIIATLYLLYHAAYMVRKAAEIPYWMPSIGSPWHPWYWAEVACFMDVFATWGTMG